MATILIFPQETRPLRKVTCDCSGNGDCDNLLCWQHSANYLAGGDKPNYPVPALRRRVNYASLWSVLRWIGYLPSGSKRF